MSSAMYATSSAVDNLDDSMDCRTLALHQYEQWKSWSQSGSWRRSRQSLMDDLVDPAAERHMYIPANEVAATPSSSFPRHLDNDEMVGRVVAFFQTIHNNHLLRQLQRAEGNYEQYQLHPYHHCDYAYTPSAADARCLQDDSLTSATAAEDASALTELGFTQSFIRNQEEIWNRTTQQQQLESFIPDWLYAAALQEGRRIKVVTVNQSTEKRVITCIGCHKNMVAASNVEIVFCPDCGCTFAPDLMS